MQTDQPMPRDRRPDALGDLRVLPDELLCGILECLTPRDVARLSCVSSVLYIFCNEEPLWMTLCLKDASGLLEYKGSWKETTLYRHVPTKYSVFSNKRLYFDGFDSLFLYKRWYRCFTALDHYSVDKGDVERVNDLSLVEFQHQYDGCKPVLINGLAETWPARRTWTVDYLLHTYGETPFRLSQRSRKKLNVTFKDYVSYMNCQHDEDPIYIFDDKFGDAAPNLLKDYTVPHLFQEDFFDVLDRDQRPPFRWLIIGPERSGASWHVDPALTSAWNTLLCGRKRWALYPPGKVPLGVTVHVNEEDGDINIESPSSLQWWLDFYPLLRDEDKPIECTQLPGETIFVPSGWWHCVLNLEITIAVTQNFVNTSNFEFVCMDMAPGHLHKGVARAGLLAVHDKSLEDIRNESTSVNSQFQDSENVRKGKRQRLYEAEQYLDTEKSDNGVKLTFSYDIGFLSKFLDEDRDHYNSVWSPSNCIGQREMRQWLHRLWTGKPGLRELIWKGASLALNVERWSAGMEEICARHNLPCPDFDERLPVGTGSNPVYLVGDYVIKIYVEGGLESSIHSLGSELEFYRLISEVKSPLQDHVPHILASGILTCDDDSYKTFTWDGKGVPDAIRGCDFIDGLVYMDGALPFGVWSKKQFEIRKPSKLELSNGFTHSSMCSKIWPYVISKRCSGDIFAQLRDELSREEIFKLASFLGNQLRHLHLLPLPSLPDTKFSPDGLFSLEANFSSQHVNIPLEWKLFLETINRRRKDLLARLAEWGDPVPSNLMQKVEEYIPSDPVVFLDVFKEEDGAHKVMRSPTWIHSDVMDDNIHLERCFSINHSNKDVNSSTTAGGTNGFYGGGQQIKWHPTHILDFSDLSIGDPLFDVIPIYLDVFRGNSKLLEQFLESYGLPLIRKQSQNDSLCCGSIDNGEKFNRLSYRAMCYCILHEENILGSIFSLWRELRTADSWEDVEEAVWGVLNRY